ncbi:MAG: co-chaperone GroES [Planctomycetota bacterium]
MKLEPLGDRVLVERLEAEDKTSGGIILPDTAKEKPQRGKVLAVGPGKVLKDGDRQKPAVKKGDVIIFTSYAGEELKIDGKEVMLMHEEDILAIVE